MKKDTTPNFYISRNFVEFGPFTEGEVAAFRQRGVIGDHDYVRSSGDHDWQPVSQWSTVAAGIVEPKTTAKAAPRKRSTTAAKASKKAA